MSKVAIVLFALLFICQPAFSENYKVGDKVVFMYWGCDSKKDVENEGVIISKQQKAYTILPQYQITRLTSYVTVEKSKVVRKLKDGE